MYRSRGPQRDRRLQSASNPFPFEEVRGLGPTLAYLKKELIDLTMGPVPAPAVPATTEPNNPADPPNPQPGEADLPPPPTGVIPGTEKPVPRQSTHLKREQAAAAKPPLADGWVWPTTSDEVAEQANGGAVEVRGVAGAGAPAASDLQPASPLPTPDQGRWSSRCRKTDS